MTSRAQLIALGIRGGSGAPTAPPLALTAPSIARSGSGSQILVGEVVTYTPGTYSGATGVAHQFRRDGVLISGAIGGSYTTVSADDGKTIDVREIATGPGALTTTQFSNGIGPFVTPAPPVALTAPSISFVSLEQGSVLTADPGTYTNSPTLTYQWRQDGTNIPGSVGTTYTTGAGDIGHNIDFVETATNAFDFVTQTATAVGPITAASGGLTPTSNLSSFTDNGVTWNLTSTAPVGLHAAGEPFAVGTSVASTSPPSVQYDGTWDDGLTYTGRWINGLMINAGAYAGHSGANPADTPQGWDSAGYSTGHTKPPFSSAASAPTEVPYSHALNKDPAVTGLSISGPATLVKAVSVTTGPAPSFTGGTPYLGRDKITNASYLTLLNAIPPAGSFRRWAGSMDKTPIFFTSDIDWSVLPSVARPAAANVLTVTDFDTKLGPINTVVGNNLFQRGTTPDLLQEGYGGDIANWVQQAMLFTMCSSTSVADRNKVAYKLIQAGLDIYEATDAGRRWSSSTFSFGGGHQWVKPLLVYAARLLHNAANVTERNKLLAWCDGTAHEIFGNDMMTFVVDRERIENLDTETSPSRIQTPGWPDWSENTIGYSLKPSNKGSGGTPQEIAYQPINCNPFIQAAMIARMIGAESLWNCPKFFEWCDTWYNREVRRNWPLGYFYLYPLEFVKSYYTTYAPPYHKVTAPAAVRKVARGRYAWIEFDEPFELANQPAPADLTVTVDGVTQTLGSFTTTASGSASTSTNNTNLPVITVASATGIRIGQRAVCAGWLPNDLFVTSINGNTIGIAGLVPATFANKPITFYDTFVWGRSMVAVLPTPLTSISQVVTIGYTKPASNFATNLGGVAAATIAPAAASNFTGLLPAGPTSRIAAFGGATAATRQYSGTALLRSQPGNKRLRMSLRFKLAAAMAANDVILASSTGSTGTFKLYCPSGTDLRLLLRGENAGVANAQQLKMPGALTGVPLNTLLTLHIIYDLTQGTQITMKKAGLFWSGGSKPNIDTSTSSTTNGINTADTFDIKDMLVGGLYVGSTNSGNSPFNGGIQEINIGWGDASLALPADFTGSQFLDTADWGANGQNVWGQNQLYYAGTVDEWNGSQPNRGNYGALSLSPLRLVEAGNPESGLASLYTAL